MTTTMISDRTFQHIHDLVRNGDEPVCAYLYDLDQLRDRTRRIVDALPPGCRMFYAMKANAEAPILAALRPVIHGFEVASLGEVEKVRALSESVPMVFGGPGKTDAELEGALRRNVGLLHVESMHELRRVDYIAARLGITAPVLLRVNLRTALPAATLQMAGRPTQFGIDERELHVAIAAAQRCAHVDLHGFHLHSLSNNLDPDAHVDLVRCYLAKARTWVAEHGVRMRVLNVGGGIGVSYADTAVQFDWDAFTTRLARMLDAERRTDWEPGWEPGWEIVFECGRFLTAHCGSYAVEVIDIKHNHGKTFAVIRGGTQHFRLPVSWQHSHPFRVVPVERWPYPFARPALRDAQVTVVGQLCTPKDVLARDVPVAHLRVGDVIVFEMAGAYGWSISHHDFLSHPHPKHLFFD